MRSSSRIFIVGAALAFALGGAACSDDSGNTPDKGVTEAGLDKGASETSPDKGASETSPDKGVSETSPDKGVTEAGSDTGGGDAAPSASYSFNIEGSQEVPAVTTNASATGKVTINAAQSEITVEITYSNLHNITQAHIHMAASGSNGPVLFTLASGTFASPFSKKLTASDFSPISGVATFADAVAAIKAGNTYVNIHTSANPGGELRGQVKN